MTQDLNGLRVLVRRAAHSLSSVSLSLSCNNVDAFEFAVQEIVHSTYGEFR